MAGEGGSHARPTRPGGAGWIERFALIGPALLALILELAVIGEYGYFRDELYYLASTEHLDWGYVDHPPLSVLILAAVRAAFGDGLIALRFLPALCMAGTVLVVGCLARRLGGGAFAQAVAGLAATFSCFLALCHVYSMNAIDLVVWSLAVLLFLETLERGSPRLWILLGLLLGLGLLNKVSVLWLGAGVGVGILLTPYRRVLRTPWPWAAAALAGLLFLPHVLWQIANDWPTAEFVRNARAEKMVSTSPGRFVLNQILVMNPLNAPLWIAGLLGCLFSRRLCAGRVLAWIWLTTALILAASGQSKAVYLALAYPGLLAAGAVLLERLLLVRPLTQGVVLVLVVAWGAFVLPSLLPVLSPEAYVRYAGFLGAQPPREERHAPGELPQHFADMFGWEELVGAVARVFAELSPEEQARCIVFAGNYGQAGAIDVLGRPLGLPPAISGHNSYWLWGPGDRSGEVAILIGGSEEGHRRAFEQIVRVETVRSRYAMPYERERSIFLARGLRMPLTELWPRCKHYQ